ncbi:MAG: hypothetical protein M1828_000341 [Chrysothrix sp. TS-e1954]|nr:MAG: hypothetical protein M1828_000341 [Chrysothrix sp. TS-e1954]
MFSLFLYLFLSLSSLGAAAALPKTDVKVSSPHTTPSSSLNVIARDSPNALSVLSAALKTYPQPAPTHTAKAPHPKQPKAKKPSVTDQEATNIAQEVQDEMEAYKRQKAKEAAQAKTQKAKEAAQAKAAKHKSDVAKSQCSTMQQNGYFTTEKVNDGKACRVVQHSCSQCQNPADCCIEGDARLGFASCNNAKDGCEQNWH